VKSHVLGPLIAVVGSSTPDAGASRAAERVGTLVAERGGVLLCGGTVGVMEDASRGARRAGGLTVGILPGDDPREANPWIRIPLATGLGFARNAVLARAAQSMIAVGGGYGTLSEMALALRFGTRVVALGSWPVEGDLLVAASEEEAVELAFAGVRGAEGGRGG
jgi:uncharacterized protein (TIGR00725 family)